MKTATMDNVKDAGKPAREREAPREGARGWLGRPAEWWHDGREFLAEVRAEMKRVTWPSRREVYATTLVVILTSIFFGLYLWGIDVALDSAVRWIFRALGGA